MIQHGFFEKRTYADTHFPVSTFQGPTFRFLAHWHHEVEVLLVLSGSMVVGINDEKRMLVAGDVAISGTGDVHWYELGDQPGTVRLLIFRPEILGHSEGWPSTFRLRSGFVCGSEAQVAPWGTLLSRIYQEVQVEEPGFELVVRGQLAYLCGLLERLWGGPVGQGPFPSHRQLLRDSIEFIHQHYRLPLVLEDVARAAGLTPGHFSRLLSRTVGSNFRTYLNGVRVEAAEFLLLTTDASVTSIAFECGFDSLRTFNRAFRALRRATPRSVRKESAGPRNFSGSFASSTSRLTDHQFRFGQESR